MDDLKFGLGFTGLILFFSWIIGVYATLLPSMVFCSIPLIYEIKEKLHSPPMKLETCQLCGNKFRIRNKTMEFEYRTVGLCPLCLDSIFQYSVPETDTLASE